MWYLTVIWLYYVSALIVVGMSVFFDAEGTTSRPIASCKNSKEKGYLVAKCHGDEGLKLESIPGNIMPEVQVCYMFQQT